MLEWCIPDKKLDVLTNRVAHDSNYFVYRPGPQPPLIGFAAFQENARRIFMDPRFKAISVDIRDLRINFSRNGDVAWFSCMVDDIGEWDGQPASWLNTRWTGVLEKRDGIWQMCLQHFSFIPPAAGQ
jgi:ketosteroid isomerase-like protein